MENGIWNPGGRHKRIGVLTAAELKEEHDRCLEVGMDECAKKAIKFDTLKPSSAACAPGEPKSDKAADWPVTVKGCLTILEY